MGWARWGGGFATAGMLFAASDARAAAPEGWLQNGKLVAGNPAAATSPNGFAVMQFATTDPERLMADWNKAGAGVAMGATKTMVRNQPIVTFILFRGCAPDVRGNCNVTVDFETTGPTGTQYAQARNAEVWVGHPAPPPQALELSAGALGLRIEDKDPLGAYQVRAVVTDHVSGVTLRTVQTLTATAK